MIIKIMMGYLKNNEEKYYVNIFFYNENNTNNKKILQIVDNDFIHAWKPSNGIAYSTKEKKYMIENYNVKFQSVSSCKKAKIMENENATFSRICENYRKIYGLDNCRKSFFKGQLVEIELDVGPKVAFDFDKVTQLNCVDFKDEAVVVDNSTMEIEALRIEDLDNLDRLYKAKKAKCIKKGRARKNRKKFINKFFSRIKGKKFNKMETI